MQRDGDTEVGAALQSRSAPDLWTGPRPGEQTDRQLPAARLEADPDGGGAFLHFEAAEQGLLFVDGVGWQHPGELPGHELVAAALGVDLCGCCKIDEIAGIGCAGMYSRFEKILTSSSRSATESALDIKRSCTRLSVLNSYRDD